MDNDTNATERPWRVEPAGGGEILIIAPRKGFNRNGVENEWAIARVGDEGLWDEDDPKHSKEDEANAELIVRAVNSYDPALQDKLTKAVKALDEVQDYIQRGGDLEELGKIVSAALRQIKESEHG